MLPGRQSPAHLELLKLVEHVLPQAEPGGVGIVELHHLSPDPHRQPEIGLLLPGDRGDLQGRRPRSAWKMVPLNSSWSGTSPSSRRREVLRRGHVEVERARDREVDHGAAGERWDDEADVSPEQPAQRLAPSRGLAEQVEQPRFFPNIVSPSRRLDPDLTSQRDGRDGHRRRLVGVHDPKLEHQVRRCGHGHRSGLDHVKGQFRHARPFPRFARSAQLVEEAPDAVPDLRATGKAAPMAAEQADELVTFIDRDAEILLSLAHAVDQQGLDVASSSCRTGFSASSSCQASSDSSDSVAPAGLG